MSSPPEVKEITLEDVSRHLEEAKLNQDDLYPTAQCIHFAPMYSVNNSKYLLLEADNDLLEEIKSEDSIQFKGNDDDEVVLTTRNNTYDIVLAETSNSLLLVRDFKFKNELLTEGERHIHKVYVHKIIHDYLQILPGKRSHLRRIVKLLKNSKYAGPELEYQMNAKLYTHDELFANVQSSEREFKEFLDTLLTVEIDGKIRLLETEYHFRVISYMLKLIEENSWNLNEIDYETTISSLSDIVPLEILDGLFKFYAEESKLIDFVQLYRYNDKKICKFFAQILLSNAGKFNLQEFLQAWSESVPEGMVTKEDMLIGIAIIDRSSKPNVIWYLSEEDLSDDINERLKVLFENKKMWTLEEITPYLENLTTSILNVSGLLAKYARVSNINGIKYYSAKYV